MRSGNESEPSLRTQSKTELLILADRLPPVLRHAVTPLITTAEPGSIYINPRSLDTRPIMSLKDAREFVENDFNDLRQRLSRVGISIGGNQVTNQAIEDLKAHTFEHLQRRYNIVE